MPEADANLKQDGAADKGYGRPVSIEEFSNHFVVHPLSDIIAKIAIKTGVSANFVSCLGLVAGLIAAVFYFYQANPLNILYGFLCMFAWHVFDGADGRVARATDTSSAFGRIFDGICDHLVFGTVYIAIVLYTLKAGGSLWVWLLVLLAGISHAVQAAGYEERRQKFQRRSRGKIREEIAENLLSVDGKKSALAAVYDSMQRLVAGRKTNLDNILAKTPENAQTLINQTAPIVRTWALLNANNRTVMIAVFATLGRPVLYFLYEIILLNMVLAGLLFCERSAENRIAGTAMYPTRAES